MRFEIDAVCDVGCIRPHNEDMILIGNQRLRDSRTSCTLEIASPTGHAVIAVADGMGGSAAGEIASEQALQGLTRLLQRLPDDLDAEELAEALSRWAADTHQSLTQAGIDDPAQRGMGTTIVGLLVYNDQAYRFHAGDSRLYRQRHGELSQLTLDHSARVQQGDASIPSNLITNSLGGGAHSWLEFAPLEGGLRQGDRFLLSSDGLHDLVDASIIGSLLDSERGLATDTLLSIAHKRGGKDNISIIIADLHLLDPKQDASPIPENPNR